uniref:Olfactory receptor n=1 Tax=Pseudonaja textilis TaxID=8673 RepID=A0A670Z4T2_PSETE
MEESNTTVLMDFYLTELSDLPEVQIALFMVILLIYLTTLAGNGSILMAIGTDAHLQTPMYFFLSNLSLLDILCPTVIVPKMLQIFLSKDKKISFVGCITQMYVFASFADAECLLLAAMAYDRYMAICNPLIYPALMSHRVCFGLVVGSYLIGSVTSLIHTYYTFHLSFCGSNIINHFFCDVPPLLALSCSNTHINEILLFALCGFIQMSTFLLIVISYVYVICTILRIHSAEGRQKAFSTCTSHLTAVALYYGTLLFTYLRPSSSYILNTDKIVSVFYTVVFPMLNPLIYTLRNEEVKDAFNKLLQRKLKNKCRLETGNTHMHKPL